MREFLFRMVQKGRWNDVEVKSLHEKSEFVD